MGYHVNACALQDICQQVFEAVHKGDATTVPSLLLQHRLSPDLTNMVSNVIVNFVVLYHYYIVTAFKSAWSVFCMSVIVIHILACLPSFPLFAECLSCMGEPGRQGYHTAVHLFLLLSFLLKTFVVKQDKRTLLMVACAEGHVSVVQALLRCKASVNIADSVRL